MPESYVERAAARNVDRRRWSRRKLWGTMSASPPARIARSRPLSAITLTPGRQRATWMIVQLPNHRGIGVAGSAEFHVGASSRDDFARQRCGDLVFVDHAPGSLQSAAWALTRPLRKARHDIRRTVVGTTGSGGILGSSSMMRIRVTSPEPDVAARDVTAAPSWGGDPAVTLGCDKGGRNRLGAERRSTIVKCAFDGMKRRTAGGGSGPIRPTDVSIQSASCGPPVDSFPSSTIEASAPSHRP
jgi:hypothetical protein